jgi:hypothetical protein
VQQEELREDRWLSLASQEQEHACASGLAGHDQGDRQRLGSDARTRAATGASTRRRAGQRRAFAENRSRGDTAICRGQPFWVLRFFCGGPSAGPRPVQYSCRIPRYSLINALLQRSRRAYGSASRVSLSIHAGTCRPLVSMLPTDNRWALVFMI